MTLLVIDTSAAVAVLADEPEGAQVARLLDSAERRVMSAATLVELGIVIAARFGPVGSAIVERFLRAADIEVQPVDREQADLAIEAWQSFGKGNHPASLNFGDCFSYALAVRMRAAVLCTGDDFEKADVEVVRPS